MKKLLATLISALLILSAFAITASAEESATVFVTITDGEGEFALVLEKITVADTDNDGKLTINDALYCAHEAKYQGGAEAGYACVETEYGLSLSKLWGEENGGSYGYYLNNASAWSLYDTVSDGDFLNAYVYTDLTAWSDTYCYFDKNSVDATPDSEIALKLTYCGYDAEYNPVTLPVANATIALDGIDTEYKTDENGIVKFTVAEAGEYIVSAVSDTQTLVPPVCVVTVAESNDESNDESQENSDSVVTPGDNSSLMIMVILGIAAFAVAIAASRKHNAY